MAEKYHRLTWLISLVSQGFFKQLTEAESNIWGLMIAFFWCTLLIITHLFGLFLFMFSILGTVRPTPDPW